MSLGRLYRLARKACRKALDIKAPPIEKMEAQIDNGHGGTCDYFDGRCWRCGMTRTENTATARSHQFPTVK